MLSGEITKHAPIACGSNGCEGYGHIAPERHSTFKQVFIMTITCDKCRRVLKTNIIDSDPVRLSNNKTAINQAMGKWRKTQKT